MPKKKIQRVIKKDLSMFAQGAIKSPEDYRKVPYKAVLETFGLADPLPPMLRQAYLDTVEVMYQKKIGSCFVAGTKITMADMTRKNIEDVKVGDEVVDAYGKVQRVTDTFSKLWQGNMYKIQPFSLPEPIVCTPNHPFLLENGHFINAEELTKKDYVVLTGSTITKDKTDFSYETNTSFLKLLGLFLAEGHVERNMLAGGRITFSFHTKETHLHKFVIDTVKDVWGVDAKVYTSGNKTDIRINKKHVAKIFEDLGGNGTSNKRIHNKFMCLKPELQIEIIRGWLLGDGSLTKQKSIMGVSISRILIEQMFDMCLRLGIVPSLQIRPATIGHREAYVLEINRHGAHTLFPDKYKKQVQKKQDKWRGVFSNNLLSRRVKSIEILRPYKNALKAYNTVYNLETTGSHTYIANHIAVHNCVGHAFAFALTTYWYEKTGKVILFSPRFIYAIAKCLDGFPGEGTYPSKLAKWLVQYGCCTLAVMPNDSDLVHEEYVFNRDINAIPKKAFENALQYRPEGYAFVNVKDQEELRRAILNHGAVCLLAQLGREWWTDENGNVTWEAKKILPIGAPKEIISGHEVVGIGWNVFEEFRNSWSDKWANAGNGDLDFNEYKPYLIEGIVLTSVPRKIINEVKRLPEKPVANFQKDLYLGLVLNADVKRLQDCLKYLGFLDVTVLSTSNYWTKTRDAVIAYQKARGITPTNGRCGPQTRVMINEELK